MIAGAVTGRQRWVEVPTGSTTASAAAVDALMRAARDQVVIVVGSDLAISSVSAGASRLLGWSRTQIHGMRLSELLVPDEPHGHLPLLGFIGPLTPPAEALLRDEVVDERWTFRTRQGRRLVLDVSGSSFKDADGQVLGAVVMGSVVSDSAAVERRLADSEEQFQLVFDKAPTAMALVSLSPLTRGRLRRVNPAMTTFTGRRGRELRSMRMEDLLHLDEVEEHLAYLARAADMGETEPDGVERQFVHVDGSVRWGRKATAIVRASSSRDPHLLVLIQDITQHKREKEALEHAALHDPLTGLANRTLFRDRLELTLQTDRRLGRGSALLYIDLDDFKPVNDRFGHATGDLVLKTVARRLQEVMRSDDTVARLGGDEFAVICPGLRAQDAAVVVQRISDALAVHLLLPAPDGSGAVHITLTASTGVAFTEPADCMRPEPPGQPIGPKDPAEPESGSSAADRLLREADAAMYALKQSPRSRRLPR